MTRASDADVSLSAIQLDLIDVAVDYGAASVLDGLSLSVRRGELLSLLGPSGCGKTTLLRAIAGLVPPKRGKILIGGRDVARLPAHRRKIGVVFQNYALFPNLDVAGNVAFGLRAQRRPKAEIATRVAEALDLVRMNDFARARIRELSGGQQQRIAVARALATEPSLLLLDEPFSALDRQLRETVQIELRRLLRRLDITAIFVTHDQDEALLMSDRIAVMNRGRIEQAGSATEIHARPATPFILDFIGLSTRLGGEVRLRADPFVTVATAFGEVRARGSFAPGAKVVVAVRAERIALAEAPRTSANAIVAPLADVLYRGSRHVLEFHAGPDDRVTVELAGASQSPPIGAALTLCWAIDDTLIYPIGGDRRQEEPSGHA